MRMCPLCLFDRCDDTATSCRQCGAELTPLDEEVSDRISAAWFHYLRLPKIGTVELVPGHAFTMGRDPRSDLVLPKARGAQIATIFWTDGYEEATVKEMGAPEPVKVEGVRIKGTRTLKGGEELEVGPMRMSYLKRATQVDDAINPFRSRNKPEPKRGQVAVSQPKRAASPYYEPNARKRPAPAKGQGAPARVVIATPAQVAKILESKKATGTLRVKSRRGRGWVTLMSGRPQFAAFGDLIGLKALEAILRLDRARCQMVPGLPRRGSGKQIEVQISQVVAHVRPPARRPPPRGQGSPPAGGRVAGAKRPPPRGGRRPPSR